MDSRLAKEAQLAQNKADVCKAQSLFPKATRDYHAVTLTLQKAAVESLLAAAQLHVFAVARCNYPGPYSPYNNQLDPNISVTYDIKSIRRW